MNKLIFYGPFLALIMIAFCSNNADAGTEESEVLNENYIKKALTDMYTEFLKNAKPDISKKEPELRKIWKNSKSLLESIGIDLSELFKPFIDDHNSKESEKPEESEKSKEPEESEKPQDSDKSKEPEEPKPEEPKPEEPKPEESKPEEPKPEEPKPEEPKPEEPKPEEPKPEEPKEPEEPEESEELDLE